MYSTLQRFARFALLLQALVEYYCRDAEYARERTVKIGQYLAKL